MITTLQFTPGGTVDILRRQHQRLNQLLVDYFAARSESRRWDVIPLVLNAIKLHMALEAEAFFPVLELATGDQVTTAAAAKEREAMELLVEELSFPDPGSADHTEKMYVLWDFILKHIARAERAGGLFERWQASSIDDAAAAARMRICHHDLWRKQRAGLDEANGFSR